MRMNRKVCTSILLSSIALLVVSAMIWETKAAPAIVLTPTSGEPGSSITVSGTGFAASISAGIGFGPEKGVVDEVVTVTNPATQEFYGFTSQHPIKPGTFRWKYLRGAVQLTASDNGDGTLSDPSGFMSSGTINYTSGYFHRIMSSSTMTYTSDTFSYTTYQFEVTPAGLATDGSGAINRQITVPSIWNETHPVTVIDSAGHVGASSFTVFGSTVIPEAFTIGAMVLLSSTALIVSSYCLRKRPITKEVT
jgi:hypothetical protein